MLDSAPQLTCTVTAHRVDAHGSTAQCKEATLILDTDLAGRLDAFNPAELLLAVVAACMLKSIERLAPMLQFTLRGVSVSLTGVRQDVPPRLESITYQIRVETEESDQRLALLPTNVRKYGTVSNTVSPGTALDGTMIRAMQPAP